MKCKYCMREITPEIVEMKRQIKIKNALASLAKAKANGTKMGPKSTFDVEKAIELRKKFFKYSDIGKLMGVSRQTIRKQLKIRGIS